MTQFETGTEINWHVKGKYENPKGEFQALIEGLKLLDFHPRIEHGRS